MTIRISTTRPLASRWRIPFRLIRPDRSLSLAHSGIVGYGALMTRAADGGEESDVGFRTWHAEVPPTGLMDRLIHPFNEVQIRGWMRRSFRMVHRARTRMGVRMDVTFGYDLPFCASVRSVVILWDRATSRHCLIRRRLHRFQRRFRRGGASSRIHRVRRAVRLHTPSAYCSRRSHTGEAEYFLQRSGR